MTHPNKERLRDYCAGNLPDYQAPSLEEHLAACEDCAALARRFYTLNAVLDGHTAGAHGEAYRLREATHSIERSGALSTMPERTAAFVREAIARGTLDVRQITGDMILPVISAGLYAAVTPIRRFQTAVYQLHEFQRREAVQLTSAVESQPPRVEPLPVIATPEPGGEYSVISMAAGTVLVMAGSEPVAAYRLELDRAQNCWTCSISVPARSFLLILPPR